MASRTVKVRVVLTVEVPIDEWAEAYGVAPTRGDVRNDFLRHILNVVQNGNVPVDVV